MTERIVVEDLELTDLRSRRRELQQLEDAVSYVRRLAQGRADLVRVEASRRAAGRSVDATPDGLRAVLADRLLGAPRRPPRPTDDHSGHSLAIELDELCGAHGFGRLRELDAAALGALAAALDAFEGLVSARRKEIFVELDALTDELVRRLAASGTDDPGGRG